MAEAIGAICNGAAHLTQLFLYQEACALLERAHGLIRFLPQDGDGGGDSALIVYDLTFNLFLCHFVAFMDQAPGPTKDYHKQRRDETQSQIVALGAQIEPTDRRLGNLFFAKSWQMLDSVSNLDTRKDDLSHAQESLSIMTGWLGSGLIQDSCAFEIMVVQFRIARVLKQLAVVGPRTVEWVSRVLSQPMPFADADPVGFCNGFSSGPLSVVFSFSVGLMLGRFDLLRPVSGALDRLINSPGAVQHKDILYLWVGETMVRVQAGDMTLPSTPAMLQRLDNALAYGKAHAVRLNLVLRWAHVVSEAVRITLAPTAPDAHARARALVTEYAAKTHFFYYYVIVARACIVSRDTESLRLLLQCWESKK